MSAEIEIIQKAKVAIVDSDGAILTLRRSQFEASRPGELDWPGGTFDKDETSISKVIAREVEIEEIPGVKLNNLRTLDVSSKILNGAFKVSYLLAATAEFPTKGIELSHEHDEALWIPQEDYDELLIPKKYRAAVALGASIFNELTLMYQSNSQHVPVLTTSSVET